MNIRQVVVRCMAGAAPIIAALAISAPPPALAAARVILIDDSTTATDCGKYTGSEAKTSLDAEISSAASGATVMICPGEYTLTNEISIVGKKLTIKRAFTGDHSRP